MHLHPHYGMSSRSLPKIFGVSEELPLFDVSSDIIYEHLFWFKDSEDFRYNFTGRSRRASPIEAQVPCIV